MSNRVTDSIIVKGKVDNIYELWADFENFPLFMKNIKSVEKTGDRTSHWVMQGPLGKDIEWDAETTRLDKNSRVAWNTKDREAKGLKTSGQVTFKPLGQDETEVTVTMQYDPPAGALGEAVANIVDNPEARLHQDLRNFKSYAEGMRDRTAH